MSSSAISAPMIKRARAGRNLTTALAGSSSASSVTTVAPGATQEVTGHFFAGAKEISLLGSYMQRLGIPHFELAVSWGWFIVPGNHLRFNATVGAQPATP